MQGNVVVVGLYSQSCRDFFECRDPYATHHRSKLRRLVPDILFDEKGPSVVYVTTTEARTQLNCRVSGMEREEGRFIQKSLHDWKYSPTPLRFVFHLVKSGKQNRGLTTLCVLYSV